MRPRRATVTIAFWTQVPALGHGSRPAWRVEQTVAATQVQRAAPRTPVQGTEWRPAARWSLNGRPEVTAAAAFTRRFYTLVPLCSQSVGCRIQQFQQGVQSRCKLENVEGPSALRNRVWIAGSGRPNRSGNGV